MTPGTPDQNQPQNPLEQMAEHIPSKEEIFGQLAVFCENPVPSRMLEDEKGIYLLEVEVPDAAKPGDSTLYIYAREGTHSNQNRSAATVIYFIPFRNGEPMQGGNNLAQYNSATKRWDRVE